MKLHAYGMTDTGVKRPENEDSLLVAPTKNLYAVADGLGGLPGGHEASSRLIELLEERVSEEDQTKNIAELVPLIEEINLDLRNEVFEAHPYTGAGTTLTMAIHKGETLHIAHIGDSALYHIHEGKIEKLTEDHTMEQEYIRENGEEARESMPSEYAHTLTQCLGLLRQIQVDRIDAEITPSDQFLICSDGLYRVVTDEEMLEIVTTEPTSEKACERLVNLANQNGGPDNITVVVLSFE